MDGIYSNSADTALNDFKKKMKKMTEVKMKAMRMMWVK